jgi:hypothetical protein
MGADIAIEAVAFAPATSVVILRKSLRFMGSFSSKDCHESIGRIVRLRIPPGGRMEQMEKIVHESVADDFPSASQTATNIPLPARLDI